MLQFVLSGLAIGSIYGLMGMALAISFYVTRVINFAQGQMMMIAVMIVSALTAAGFPAWVAVVAGLLVSCSVGVLSYLIAVKPILAFDRFSFGWLVSTLGFAVAVENGAAYIWGPTSQAFPPILNNISVHIGDAVLTAQQLLAIGANTTAVAIVAFAISGLFAGIAGVMIGPSTFANPYLGGTFGTAGFIAMMIGGGTEKPVAAMFGGLLLGVLAEGANATINSQASDWFPFLVLVIILIVSPRGLFSSGSVLLRLRPPQLARG